MLYNENKRFEFYKRKFNSVGYLIYNTRYLFLLYEYKEVPKSCVTKKECLSLVWPMRNQDVRNCSLMDFLKAGFHPLCVGFIKKSLLCIFCYSSVDAMLYGRIYWFRFDGNFDFVKIIYNGISTNDFPICCDCIYNNEMNLKTLLNFKCCYDSSWKYNQYFSVIMS